MTLIAYSAGVLLADSVAEEVYDGLSHRVRMDKIQISPSAHFAYAYSGDKILKRHLEAVHDALALALIKAQLLEREFVFQVAEKDQVFFRRGHFIVMSHDRVFCSDSEDPAQPFHEIELTDTVAFGVTAPAFRVTLASGLDPKPAANRACTFVYGCTTQEAGVVMLRQKDLRPFPPNIAAEAAKATPKRKGKANATAQ